MTTEVICKHQFRDPDADVHSGDYILVRDAVWLASITPGAEGMWSVLCVSLLTGALRSVEVERRHDSDGYPVASLKKLKFSEAYIAKVVNIDVCHDEFKIKIKV